MIFYFFLSGLLFALLLLELGMFILVRCPNLLSRFSSKLQNSIGNLYASGERSIMQFMPGMGNYDPELSYTLKPGSFVFSGMEFSNVYNVNSLGVRGSEDDLKAPDLVVCGDSFALSWGVGEEESFTRLMQKKTGMKILNTAVPSYGTVREMMMLRRVDRSKLKWLIVEYCSDDYDENMFFYLKKRPRVMSAATYAALLEKHKKPKTYYLGKYLKIKIKKRISESFGKKETAEQFNEADLFLYVLSQNQDLLKDIRIIVFEMNGKNQSNSFINDLARKVANTSDCAFVANLITIDLTRYLERRHFYVLDDHLTPEGHRILADVLYEAIINHQENQREMA